MRGEHNSSRRSTAKVSVALVLTQLALTLTKQSVR
jgi:hypothetical protein